MFRKSKLEDLKLKTTNPHKNICCCVKINIFLKSISSFLRERFFFVSAIIFVFIGVIFLCFGIKESAIPEPKIHVDLLTAFGSSFIAATLLYSMDWNKLERKKESSKFYLVQIQKYFNDALTYISAADNNSVKWHRGVNALKAVEDLYKNLSEENHREIFLRDYVDTGFAIVDILNSIDTHLFFYGVDYMDFLNDENADAILYQKSGSNSLDLKRISPDALKFLCAFYEKVNGIVTTKGIKRKPLYAIYREAWFEKIDFPYQLTDFTMTLPLVKKIYKYINACLRESQKSKSKQASDVVDE